MRFSFGKQTIGALTNDAVIFLHLSCLKTNVASPGTMMTLRKPLACFGLIKVKQERCRLTCLFIHS